MASASDSIHGRIEHARFELTRAQLLGLTLAVGLAVALAFVQEPMVHDAMHNFRHAAGVTCH